MSDLIAGIIPMITMIVFCALLGWAAKSIPLAIFMVAIIGAMFYDWIQEVRTSMRSGNGN